ncbi:MAG TPA: hypothetical protein VIU46_04475 [Gallionellaceae bacterium]
MKDEKYHIENFDEKDVELLESVISLIPDLSLVACAAKIARGKIKYPLIDCDALQPIFGGKRLASYKDRKITFAQAQRFIPKEFFPITSERDLLCKLLISFQRGSMVHAQENLDAHGGKATILDQDTILRSPAIS